MRFLLTISLIFVFNNLRAGEIDGRGVVCKIYGDTIGYFFEGDRTHEYKLTGGEEKLELTKLTPMKCYEMLIYRIIRKNVQKPHEFSNTVY